MVKPFILLALILSLSACELARNTAGQIGIGSGNARKARVEVDGVRFRARAAPDRADKRNFAVTVTPVAVNPEAALDAARYQATRYCLLTYGGSDAEWVIGPDQPLENLSVIGDTLTLQGRCTQR